MRKQNGKKILSLINYELIDLMLKDISYTEGTTESLIAEEILLGLRPGLLPENKEASSLLQTYYTEDNAISKIYRSTMLDAAARDFSSGSPAKELSLIKKLHSALCFYQLGPRDSTPHDELKWYVNQVDYYLRCLERELEKIESPELFDSFQLRNEIRFGRDLWNELKSEPHFSYYFNILSIVINTWEYSGRYTYTYRMIAAMLQIAKIPNTPANRVEIIAALRDAYK